MSSAIAMVAKAEDEGQKQGDLCNVSILHLIFNLFFCVSSFLWARMNERVERRESFTVCTSNTSQSEEKVSGLILS